MLATQYAISLPADYDMAIIRRRVAERGRLLDDYPGLTLKAYLVQDMRNGGRQNQYAPFYLWAETAATASFFWGGGGFAGIVRDFGRPSVSCWVGVDFRSGPAFDRAPVIATLQRRGLVPGEDPAREADRLRDVMEGDARASSVHSVAAAIDLEHWEAVVFTLRTARGRELVGADTFEVLHLSMPAPAALAYAQPANG